MPEWAMLALLAALAGCFCKRVLRYIRGQKPFRNESEES